jgi:hypothetical protein
VLYYNSFPLADGVGKTPDKIIKIITEFRVFLGSDSLAISTNQFEWFCITARYVNQTLYIE